MTDPSRLQYKSYKERTLEELPADHPVRLFEGHWQELRQNKAMPARKDFSPVKIPALLPYIIVLELFDEDGDRDMKVRLEGEMLMALTGKYNIGERLSRILDAAEFDRRLKEVEQVLATGQPLFLDVEFQEPNGREHSLVRGLFPFSLNPEKPGQVFVVLADEELVL